MPALRGYSRPPILSISAGAAMPLSFSPCDNWARSTIGRPEQNKRVQQQLRELLHA
jgi:hypothetical protein